MSSCTRIKNKTALKNMPSLKLKGPADEVDGVLYAITTVGLVPKGPKAYEAGVEICLEVIEETARSQVQVTQVTQVQVTQVTQGP